MTIIVVISCFKCIQYLQNLKLEYIHISTGKKEIIYVRVYTKTTFRKIYLVLLIKISMFSELL